MVVLPQPVCEYGYYLWITPAGDQICRKDLGAATVDSTTAFTWVCPDIGIPLIMVGHRYCISEQIYENVLGSNAEYCQPPDTYSSITRKCTSVYTSGEPVCPDGYTYDGKECIMPVLCPSATATASATGSSTFTSKRGSGDNVVEMTATSTGSG